MIDMNKKMKTLLQKIEKYKDDEIRIIKLKELISPKITKIQECFIIDNKDNSKNIDFKFIKKIFANKTMFEFGRNEICINYYVEPNNNLYAPLVGIVAKDSWKYKLKRKYPNEKFCFIMEVSDTHTILRFHKFREDEGMVINSDLDDNIENAILMEIV